MAVIKKIVKLVLAGFLYYSGLLRLYRWAANRTRPGRTLILVYHSVSSAEHSGNPYARRHGLAIDRRNFERQAEYLAAHYQVIPLDWLAKALRGGLPVPRNACAITFDDGLEDNYRNAFPALKKLRLPATFFVPTSYVGTDRVPWFVELPELAARLPGSGLDVNRVPRRVCPEGIAELLAALAAGEPVPIRVLMEEVKRLPGAEIERLVDALREALDADRPARGVTMSWEQAREMADAGMEIGAHTRNHRILTVESEADAEDEILGARQELERGLGLRARGFAYPNGAYDTFIKGLVEQAGYGYACSMVDGVADYNSDLYALPRRDMNDAKSTGLTGRFSPARFEMEIQGILRLLPGKRPWRDTPQKIRSGDEKRPALDT